jgi:SM-20-related protein
MQVQRLNASHDAGRLAAAFQAHGRLQIADFLEPTDARALAGSLGVIDWNLVFNSGSRHVDVSQAQLQAWGQARVDTVLAEVNRLASKGFQYLYENYPVADLASDGRLNHASLASIYAFMNSEPALAFIRSVTGAAVDFCDMQLTRYGAGHFLTVHDDDAEGKNRKLAYVLGLTPHWSPTWGGQLQFLNAEGGIEQAFVPRFNALSVFTVPQPHHVSQVATFAPKPRLSLTGWYRTRS